MPSALEPSSLVYAEACVQGAPCIGTKHGGSAAVFGPAGIAVDPDDPAELLDAMLRMADPAVAEAYGQAARRIAPLLTWEAVARRLGAAAGWLPGDAPPLPEPAAPTRYA